MRTARLLPLLVLALAACGREAAAPAAPPAAVPTSASAAVAPASPKRAAPSHEHLVDDARPTTDTRPVDSRILDVKLSNASDGKRLTGAETDHFKPTEGVFLSIHTDGTANPYTLGAKWLDASGHVLTEYSQVIPKAGPVDTVFSLSKPDGWAKGAYQVELSINGKPLRTTTFEVQ